MRKIVIGVSRKAEWPRLKEDIGELVNGLNLARLYVGRAGISPAEELKEHGECTLTEIMLTKTDEHQSPLRICFHEKGLGYSISVEGGSDDRRFTEHRRVKEITDAFHTQHQYTTYNLEGTL